MNQIIPGLCLSDMSYALGHGREYDVIINCTKSEPFPDCINTLFIRIPIDDIPSESELFIKEIIKTRVLHTIDYYVNARRKVLVHCQAGMSRSPTLVVCYLKKFRSDISDPVAYVREKRPIVFAYGMNFRQVIKHVY
jgi:hypothetical protein